MSFTPNARGRNVRQMPSTIEAGQKPAANGHAPAADAKLIRAEAIEKRFPGVHALKSVRFDLKPGEVHALMGENGAGKSTLMKILSGIYQPDSGTIEISRQPDVRFQARARRRRWASRSFIRSCS